MRYAFIMPAPMWKPDGRKLRELRESRDLSQRQLALVAKVDPQTIADIENGTRMRVRSETLKSLAEPLEIGWEDLLARGARRVVKRIADELPPRSTLDLLRFSERERPEPGLATKDGSVFVFGVAELVDTFTAPSTHEGRRFYAHGEVANQRGITPLDEIILDVPQFEGGRFEIVRKLSKDLPPFTLTVFSRRKEHTRALQAAWRSGDGVRIMLRVIVARRVRDDPERVSLTNLDGNAVITRPRTFEGVTWLGFELIAPKVETYENPRLTGKPHPWCLVIEEVLSANE